MTNDIIKVKEHRAYARVTNVLMGREMKCIFVGCP